MNYTALPFAHLNVRTLADVADDHASVPIAPDVAAHLTGCMRCRNAVQQLRELHAAVEAIRGPRASRQLLKRAMARRAAGERLILPATAETVKGRTPAPGPAITAVARTAAMILLVLGSVVGLAQGAWSVAHRNRASSTGGLTDGAKRVVTRDPRGSVPVTVGDMPRGIVPSSVAVESTDLPSAATAHQPGGVRQLGGTITTSTVSFARVTQVRPLADGRVLVHDPGARRVVLLDTSMSNPVVVIDSAAVGPTKSYGHGIGTLVPFTADSTLFLDASSQAFLVIDPGGHLGRVLALPGSGSSLVSTLTSLSNGAPVYATARGGLIYGMRLGLTTRPPNRPAPGAPEIRMIFDDSIGVMVASMQRHVVDTVAKVRSGASTWRVATEATMLAVGGQISYGVVDEWAASADGTIAVLRGRDLHLELYQPDGTHTSLPKLPFSWRPISEEVRQHLADSITADRARLNTELVANLAARAPGGGIRVPDGSAGAAGAAAGGISAGASGSGEPSGTGPGRIISPVIPVDPHDLPDYVPAFLRGALHADGDGNFWIGLTPVAPGLPDTFLIVNRAGAVIDRVAIPLGGAIVGFGSRTVYLTFTDGATTRLVRTRWKP